MIQRVIGGSGWRYLVLALPLVVGGCGGGGPTSPGNAGKVQVFAGIPPLAYLVEQIGGERVAVDVLVQPGQDPHTFEPTPHRVLALSRAAVLFKIGMPFEDGLVERVQQANSRLKVVDVGQGVEKLMCEDNCSGHGLSHGGPREGEPKHGESQHAAHQHGTEAATAKGAPDPHIWLSPPLLKIQATNIAKALSEAAPDHAAEFQKNLEQLLGRLEEAHQQFQKRLAPYRGQSFIVFHPGFAYFAHTYGLEEEAVEAGGRQPTPKQLGALIEKAKAEGIKTVFVQPQYDPHSVQVLANAIGGKVVSLDGLAKDVLKDLDDIATKVETALAESKRHGPETHQH